jgi:hypothetical protein
LDWKRHLQAGSLIMMPEIGQIYAEITEEKFPVAVESDAEIFATSGIYQLIYPLF